MEFISFEYQRVICDESERSDSFNYVQSGYLSDFHRSTLVNWAFQMGEEFEFTPETNHLCIMILDRFIARNCKLTNGQKLPTNRLQLIASGCILLASKQNVKFKFWPFFNRPYDNFYLGEISSSSFRSTRCL